MRAVKWLRSLDPNEDPSAEPVSLLALLAFAVLVAISAGMFLWWPFQPMQDAGFHASMSAQVAHYSKGTFYAEMYKPYEIFTTNSLLCVTAGWLGKILPPFFAFRLTFALGYFVGMPLANLYALRVFGRSAWGAVVAVPLCYNQIVVYGFMSWLFVTPLAVLVVALFYRMLEKPTWKRIAVVAVILTMIFMGHFLVFLWTGVLLFTMTLGGVLVTTKQALFGFPTTRPWKVAWVSFVAALPSLLLMARWAWRTKQPPPPDEYTIFQVSGDTGFKAFAAAVKSPNRAISEFWGILDLTKNDMDARFFIMLFICATIAIAISRMHKWKRPPILEIAAAMTLSSYFLVPQDFGGHEVLAPRQFAFGLYFASAYFAPVPASVSRLGRVVSIVIVTTLGSFMLSGWFRSLVKFENEEVAGLAEMIDAMPPGKRLHYVKMEPDSKYFLAHTFWHVDEFYMLQKQGQTDENPAYGAMQPIRYRKSYTPHLVDAHHADWATVQEIWDNFDLVLVHKWKPTPKQLEIANLHGQRIAQKGDWEVWSSKDVKR